MRRQLSYLMATDATKRRLRKAKVRKLAVILTLTTTSPVKETVTEKATFFVGRYSSSAAYKAACIGTKNDPLCGPDGDPSHGEG